MVIIMGPEITILHVFAKTCTDVLILWIFDATFMILRTYVAYIVAFLAVLRFCTILAMKQVADSDVNNINKIVYSNELFVLENFVLLFLLGVK
jgi:hypothetical protein